jgi:signal peptidase
LLGLIAAGLAPLAVGWPATVVMSGSMMPAITPGDVVVAKPVQASELRPGQVILFVDPAAKQTTLVHRVVSRNTNGSLVTKGDANEVADSTPVPTSAIQGRMLARVPFVGLPRYWLAHRQWLPLGASAVLLTLLVLISTHHGASARQAAQRPQ